MSNLNIKVWRQGVDTKELEKTLRKHGDHRRMDAIVHKTNVVILRPVASGLRKAARQHRKSESDPRSGKRQQLKSRKNRIAGRVRIYKSKTMTMASRVTVTRHAYWAHFLEEGTRPRQGRGSMKATKWATRYYATQEKKVQTSIEKNYDKIFGEKMQADLTRSRKRVRIR